MLPSFPCSLPRTSAANYTETRRHKALWGISAARKRPRQDFPHPDVWLKTPNIWVSQTSTQLEERTAVLICRIKPFIHPESFNIYLHNQPQPAAEHGPSVHCTRAKQFGVCGGECNCNFSTRYCDIDCVTDKTCHGLYNMRHHQNCSLFLCKDENIDMFFF